MAHNIETGVSFLPHYQFVVRNANPDAASVDTSRLNIHPTVNRRRLVMKRLLTLGAAGIAVLLLIAMPVASQAPQAAKSFSGTLTKVDTAKKVITVKGIGNQPEMTFMYDDKTEVTGDEKTVQGLAAKSGAELTVTYREQGPNRIATRIEVSEAKK